MVVDNVVNIALKKADIKIIVAPQGHGKSTVWCAMVVDDALRHIKAIRPPYPNAQDLEVEPLSLSDITIQQINEHKRIKWVKGTNIEYDLDIVRLLPNPQFNINEPRIIRIPEDHIIIPDINIYYNMSLYGIQFTKLTLAEMIAGLDDETINNGWLGVDQAEIDASARDSMTSLGKTLMKEGSQLRKAGLHAVFIYTSWQEVDSLLKAKRDEVISCMMDYKTNCITVRSQKRGEKREDVHEFYAPNYWRYFATGERRKLLTSQIGKAMAQAV